MQNQTTGYYFSLVRMAIIKKADKYWQEVDKRELLCTIDGNVSWCSHCANNVEFLRKLKEIELPYDPGIPVLDIHLKVKKLSLKSYMHLHNHCSIMKKA